MSVSAETTARTRSYYNSTDADTFYHEIWGGEDIHIGISHTEDESIGEASRRTVKTMAARLLHKEPGARVLDLGSGYGGSARFLARHFGFDVVCVNLSEKQNARNRNLNEAAGLSDRITVLDGSFEDIPCDDGAFEVVWTQDAILHGSDRRRIFQEVDRILRNGGEWIFTDPMQQAGVPKRDLGPVLSRLELESLGSVDTYHRYAEELDWEVVGIEEMPDQLGRHYRQVHSELSSRRPQLAGRVSEDYIQRMLAGLMHWVEASRASRLNWGILHFRKPA